MGCINLSPVNVMYTRLCLSSSANLLLLIWRRYFLRADISCLRSQCHSGVHPKAASTIRSCHVPQSKYCHLYSCKFWIVSWSSMVDEIHWAYDRTYKNIMWVKGSLLADLVYSISDAWLHYNFYFFFCIKPSIRKNLIIQHVSVGHVA